MGDDRLWRNVVVWIDAELKRREISRERLSEDLGHSENYLRRFLVETEKPRWDVVFRVLDAIGTPVSVVLATLDPKRSHEVFVGLTPALQPPNEGRRVLSPLTRLLRILPVPPQGNVFGENVSALTDLAELESRRFTDSKQVADECEERLRRIMKSESTLTSTDALIATGCLGIWSSIRRTKGDLASAWGGLVLALQCAEELRSQWLEARTLQRTAFVLRDFDNIAGGLFLLARAGDLYLRHGDLDGCGQTLVDRAILNYNRGACDAAEQYAARSLQYLADSDWRNISAAHWYIARCRVLSEDLQGAAGALSAASRSTRAKDPSLWAFYRKCLGDILIRSGSYSESEKAYQDALSVFRALEDTLNATEVALDLAALLTKMGRADEVPLLADELRRGLKSYPQASLPPLFAETLYLLTKPGLRGIDIEEYQERLRMQAGASSPTPDWS